MKELSIEEKAKAYDKALEIMKAYYNRTQFSSISDSKEELKTIEKAFPELRESREDEMIRIIKEVILNSVPYKINILTKDTTITAEEAIAWLERQGKNNMGISEATKQELEDNLNKALEKETPESWNEFLEKQGETSPILSNSSNIGKDEQKPAWSKEDEAFYQRLEQIVCKVDIEAFQGDRDLHSWLKSLRPQSTWKPSELQIGYLSNAIFTLGNEGDCAIAAELRELRDNLEMLRGE